MSPQDEARFAALEKRVEALEAGNAPLRRGPKHERPMTEQDAWDVKFGRLKKPMSHKDAADAIGLSYGQVFSCRGGYTFKQVRADWLDKQVKKGEGDAG